MGADDFKLRLTPAAEADLEEIWHYTATKWGDTQADRYIDGLAETFDMIASMPGIARERDEFTPPVRIHPSGRHVVVYHVESGMVLVIRVLAMRQNWMGLLEV